MPKSSNCKQGGCIHWSDCEPHCTLNPKWRSIQEESSVSLNTFYNGYICKYYEPDEEAKRHIELGWG